MDQINLAQDRKRCWALEKIVTNLWVSSKYGNFLRCRREVFKDKTPYSK
jgi:hypothetical protein